MIKIGYYPGCSLEATARDYQESIDGVAQALGLELCEVPDWNCCGATAAHSLDHAASLNLAARNLALAASGPQPVVAPCALCFNRLKAGQHELRQGGAGLLPEVAELGDPLAAEVVELNTWLTAPAMVERIAAAQVQSLAGLRPAVYYGCQGQRPPEVTGHTAHENPTGIDKLLTELGAAVVDWPHKTDCCGASLSMPRPDIVTRLTGKLLAEAKARGAECLVTGCQMCQANLEMFQAEADEPLPVLYFTELVGLALGVRQAPRWLRRHLVSPRALLERAGLPRHTWERL